MTGEPTVSASASPPARQAADRDDELVFSTRLVVPMVVYFEQRFGVEALAAALGRAGVPLATLRDPAMWISTAQLLAISREMVAATGNPLLTYEAGLALAQPALVGPTWHVVRALGGPEFVYERLTEYTELSRITRWTLLERGPQRAVLRFDVQPGHRDDPLFCLNRQGALAGIPGIFDLPPATIEHPVCLHEGGACCTYRVRWAPRVRGEGMLPWAAVAASVASVGLGATAGLGAALGAASAAVIVLALHARALQRRAVQVSADLRDEAVASRVFTEEYTRKLRERILLERVDALTRRAEDPVTLVGTALREIRNTLGYDRAMFLEVDAASGRLSFRQGEGFLPAVAAALGDLDLGLTADRADPQLFANVLRSGRGLHVEDVADFRGRLLPHNRALVDLLGSRAFVATPVATADGPLGLLVVDQVAPDRQLGPRDVALLEQVGHQMGLALANARLVARLRREREELRAALLTNQKLSQYLPQAVVARIEAAPEEALRLGGARRRAAVLFSDVVGFTPWAEVVSPEQVVRFLNALFAAMDPEIDRCGGILDKRIGDGMMVVFLEQDGGEPPARRALRCGLALQAAVVALNADPALPRSEPFALRVGVAYGEPVAGNIGSMRRLEYTVIGDVVNVASRLEGACAPGEVTATAQAVAAAGPGVAAESRGHLVVKGRQQPVEAFSIRSVGPWTSEP